jgi:hypothetical protein
MELNTCKLNIIHRYDTIGKHGQSQGSKCCKESSPTPADWQNVLKVTILPSLGDLSARVRDKGNTLVEHTARVDVEMEACERR